MKDLRCSLCGTWCSQASARVSPFVNKIANTEEKTLLAEVIGCALSVSQTTCKLAEVIGYPLSVSQTACKLAQVIGCPLLVSQTACKLAEIIGCPLSISQTTCKLAEVIGCPLSMPQTTCKFVRRQDFDKLSKLVKLNNMITTDETHALTGQIYNCCPGQSVVNACHTRHTRSPEPDYLNIQQIGR